MNIDHNKVKLLVVRDHKGTPIATIAPGAYELTTMKDKTQILTITQLKPKK